MGKGLTPAALYERSEMIIQGRVVPAWRSPICKQDLQNGRKAIAYSEAAPCGNQRRKASAGMPQRLPHQGNPIVNEIAHMHKLHCGGGCAVLAAISSPLWPLHQPGRAQSCPTGEHHKIGIGYLKLTQIGVWVFAGRSDRAKLSVACWHSHTSSWCVCQNVNGRHAHDSFA